MFRIIFESIVLDGICRGVGILCWISGVADFYAGNYKPASITLFIGSVLIFTCFIFKKWNSRPH